MDDELDDMMQHLGVRINSQHSDDFMAEEPNGGDRVRIVVSDGDDVVGRVTTCDRMVTASDEFAGYYIELTDDDGQGYYARTDDDIRRVYESDIGEGADLVGSIEGVRIES